MDCVNVFVLDRGAERVYESRLSWQPAAAAAAVGNATQRHQEATRIHQQQQVNLWNQIWMINYDDDDGGGGGSGDGDDDDDDETQKANNAIYAVVAFWLFLSFFLRLL